MNDTILILPQFDFQQITPSILLDRGKCALAPLRTRDTAIGRELLVGPWETRARLPQGDELPPLAEYAVLTCNSTGDLTAAQMPQAIHPKRSHLVLGIALEPRDRAALPVCLWERDRIMPLSEVRLIGSRLLRLPEEPAAIAVAQLRDSRTRGALPDLFDRLSSLATVLVGAGRGASELARQLVAAGVRRLAIIDHDTLGPENLNAMPHAAPRHIGQAKAVVLAKALQRNQPELSVSCLADSVTTAAALGYLDRTRADTVFSFVDNDAARLATSWKCRQGMMVHVDVGTLIRHDEKGCRVMQADIRLFEPGRGCVACVPKLPQLDDALYELSAPDGALHRGPPQTWDQERSGSLLHLNSFACALAIELWVGYLAGTVRTSHWIRVQWPAGEPPRIESAAVQPPDDCPFCNLATWK